MEALSDGASISQRLENNPFTVVKKTLADQPRAA
jgi:hypothetical protein